MVATLDRPKVKEATCPPADIERIRSSRLRTPKHVVAVFALMTLGLIGMVASNLPLIYDGGHFFLRVVNDNYPCTPFYRYGMGLFQRPAMIAAQLTDNVALVRAVFSFSFAVSPLFAIVASWFLVRSHKPWLFVWPVLAIGVTSIVAQPFRVGESLIACELAWPVLMAVLVPLTTVRTLYLLLLGFIVASLHPTAVPFLGLTALTALCFAIFGRRADRKQLVIAALGLIAFAAVRTFLVAFCADPYELKELVPDRVRSHVVALFSHPCIPIAAGGSLMAAVLLFFTRTPKVAPPAMVARAMGAIGSVMPRRRWKLPASTVRIMRGVRLSLANQRWIAFLSLTSLLASGIAAAVYSSYFKGWDPCWSYLRFLSLFFMPAMLFCIFDSLQAPRFTESRKLFTVTCALMFCLSAVTQGCVFWKETNRLNQVIANDRNVIVDSGDYPWLKETPFKHWSLPCFVIAMQDRKVKKIVLPHDRATIAKEEGVVKVIPWDGPFINRWYTLPDVTRP